VKVYERLIRPVLFQLDPESAHNLSFAVGEFAQDMPGVLGLLHSCSMSKIRRSARLHPETSASLCGKPIHFRCGLAAGFDKDGRVLLLLEALGCPFVEVGTVTPKAQPGNERPRIFRLSEDKALINRMGFPSQGVAALKVALQRFSARSRGSMSILVNIGKNKETALSEAWRDYLSCVSELAVHQSTFVLNVSSPNTPELRSLQSAEALRSLLIPILESDHWSENHHLFIKLSPDEESHIIDGACEVVEHLNLDGLVLTNTTMRRSDSLRSNLSSEQGGLSGLPLRDRSLGLVKYARKSLAAQRIIIGVGGISTGADVKAFVDAGADLTECYTGLIYRGPGLFCRLADEYFRDCQGM
jgi:dihydroorotate dehydrogenase